MKKYMLFISRELSLRIRTKVPTEALAALIRLDVATPQAIIGELLSPLERCVVEKNGLLHQFQNRKDRVPKFEL